MGYIYKIINNLNQKIYIGKTSKTIEDRFKGHIRKAKQYTNRYLYDAMNHYGYENFSVEEVEECDNAMLDDRERFWIQYYKSNQSEFGYNMTEGGDGGDTLTNNPNKEAIIQKIAQANTGQKRTPEQKAKMSLAQKGVYYIPINKEELFNDIKNMSSIEEMCEKYQISRRSLYKRCQDYFNQTPTEIRGDRLTHTNTMHIDLDKKLLYQYLKEDKTISEMAQILGVSKETVRKRIIEYFKTNTVREARKYVKSN